MDKDNKPTFYWYDFETFGLNKRTDRPAQFAGIRTDMAFKPVGRGDLLVDLLHRTLHAEAKACAFCQNYFHKFTNLTVFSVRKEVTFYLQRERIF